MQDWMQVYWADNFEPFLSSGNPFLHLVVHVSSHCFLNSGSAFRFSKSGLGGLGEQFERPYVCVSHSKPLCLFVWFWDGMSCEHLVSMGCVR